MLFIKRLIFIPYVLVQIAYSYGKVEKGKLTKDQFGAVLRKKLELLGPTFIKVGQILSLRPDLIPIEYCTALRDLLDHTKEIPLSEVMDILKVELGKNPKTVFSHIGKSPIGSASIAQVHKGRLLSGEYVAIKVKKPGIESLVRTDVFILKILNVIFVNLVKDRINSSSIITDLEAVLDKEVNFMRESSNIERFAEDFKEFNYVITPKVFWEYTTQDLLIMDFIPGIKLSEVFSAIDKDPALRSIETIEVKGLKIAKKKLTKQLVAVVAHSVFETGFFHADPHPANIILTFDGKIAYIDFGMVGDLLNSEKVLFREIVYCIATNDEDKLLELLVGYNQLTGNTSPDKTAIISIKHALHDLLGQFISSNQKNFPITKFLYSLGSMSFKYHFPPPPFLMMISKQVFTLEGLATYLYPELNPVQEFKPYVYSYRTKDTVKKFSGDKFLHILEESITLGTTMPENLNAIINNIKDEGLINLNGKKLGTNKKPYFMIIVLYLIFLGIFFEFNAAFKELTLLLWGSIITAIILLYFILFKKNG